MDGLLVPLNDDWGDSADAGAAAYPSLADIGALPGKRAGAKYIAKRLEKQTKELEKLASGTVVLGKKRPAVPQTESERKGRALPAADTLSQPPAKKQKAARGQVEDKLGRLPATAPQRSKKTKGQGGKGLEDASLVAVESAGASAGPGAERTDHERPAGKKSKRKRKPAPPAASSEEAVRAGGGSDGRDAVDAPPSVAPPGTQAETADNSIVGKKAAAKQGRQAAAQQAGAAGGREEAAAPEAEAGPDAAPGLLERMAARLSGSKFRWLNEALYTTTGEEAFELMQEQPGLFQQYHAGFQQQTKGWPQQPVEAAIRWLKGLPASLRVADFGCGDAALALAVPQRVACLDLVATRPGVIACNMADTPLETGSMDCAVFCLALMGTDYPAFLAEAARVLKAGGRLWIAEVRSRFVGGGGEDFRPFLAALARLGFRHEATDAGNRMFVVFRLAKAGAAAGEGGGPWPELKPCLYKRR